MTENSEIPSEAQNVEQAQNDVASSTSVAQNPVPPASTNVQQEELSPIDIVLNGNNKLKEFYFNGNDERKAQLDKLKSIYKMANEEPDKFAEAMVANGISLLQEQEKNQKEDEEYNKQLAETEIFFKNKYGDDYTKRVSEFFDKEGITSFFKKNLNDFAFSSFRDFIRMPLGAGLFAMLVGDFLEKVSAQTPNSGTSATAEGHTGIATGKPDITDTGYINDDNFHQFPHEQQRVYLDERASGKRTGKLSKVEIAQAQKKLLDSIFRK